MTVGMLAVLFVLAAPAGAMAHGDSRLVDEVLVLAPGASARFEGELHYHRLVGEVAADGPVQVRFVAAGTGIDVLGLGPGTAVSFNELVRCCDTNWAPHTLIIDNPGDSPVTVTARAQLVHDDLAVMVDGAEDGTRISILLLALGWAALVWRAARRRDAGVPLRTSAMGLALLAIVVVGLGSYATLRYGVGGAPSIVAGNADLPVLPMNGIVSRASLLMGVAMLGWARVGLWWVRTGPGAARGPWLAVGALLAGAVLTVALAVTAAYGGPWSSSAGWSAAPGRSSRSCSPSRAHALDHPHREALDVLGTHAVPSASSCPRMTRGAWRRSRSNGGPSRGRRDASGRRRSSARWA